MSLATECADVGDNFRKSAPPQIIEIVEKGSKDFKESYDPKSAIQVGQPLPTFQLKNAIGEEVKSTDLLAHGPLLISFYRGEWCPYCNLELAALQKNLDAFKAKGVTLVAISPELPNQSLSTQEKHGLKFPVLSDVGNVLARKLDILFAQPKTMATVFDAFHVDLKARNGDDSLEVPIPAVLLVDGEGIVRNTFVEPDHTKRLEPAVALEWIDAL